jgi:hypothetical protein
MDIRRCSREELDQMNEEIRKWKALRQASSESPVVKLTSAEQLELWEPESKPDSAFQAAE